MAYLDYSLMEYIGFIVSLFALPLLGFIAGRQHTTARLSSERERADEIRSLYEVIENNRNDVADQVRSIYVTGHRGLKWLRVCAVSGVNSLR